MKKNIVTTCIVCSTVILSTSVYADSYFSTKSDSGFKRFSVSAGWLHAMPQGKANNFNNSTAIKDGTVAENGSVKKSTLLGVVDPDNPLTAGQSGLLSLFPDDTDLGDVPLLGNLSGSTTIGGLENWQSANTGLEADDVDTLGLMMNYHFTDNWSLEIKAGVPPKVDIQGKGFVYAPFSGTAKPSGIGEVLGDIMLKKDISITDLEQGGSAASARAWIPAAEIHYQFGTSGVNKFRPYIGVGVMYAYFNDLEMNSGIRQDLVNAGHMIQNIKDNKAGAALEGKESSGKMRVDLDAEDSFAPIATLGATYDFNDRWFAVGSVSYAKLSSDTTITVNNENTGEELIRAKSKIDIDPIITYAGIGYRF